MRKLSLIFMMFILVGVLVVPAFAHESREVGEFEIEAGWHVEPIFVGMFNGAVIFINLHSAEAAAMDMSSEAGHDEAATMDMSSEAGHDEAATMDMSSEASHEETATMDMSSEASHDEAVVADEHTHASASGVARAEETLQLEIRFGPVSRLYNLQAVPDEPGHYIVPLVLTRPGDYILRFFGTINGVEFDETFNSADGLFNTVEPAGDVMFPDDAGTPTSDLQARIDELSARLDALEGQ